MKISKKTLEVLANLATIQKNLVITPGNKLTTLSEARHILAEIEVEDTFPSEVLIYDLDEFLSALNLVPDGDIKFEDDSVVVSNGSAKVKYHFASKAILTFPEKEINMPESVVTFEVSKEDVTAARKAASTFGHSTISLNHEDGVATLSVIDPTTSDSNFYSQKIGAKTGSDAVCQAQFDVANLKMLPGDYSVEVASSLISKWTNNESKAVYFLSMEKSSTF